MNIRLVESIANAVLYEGYMLYPYRPSAIKNRQRFNFGVLYPQSYGLAHGEQWSMQTECLLAGAEQTMIGVRVRFLHLLAREELQAIRNPQSSGCRSSWQKAVEREVIIPEVAVNRRENFRDTVQFLFPGEVNEDNGVVRRQEAINGLIEIAAQPVTERLSRIAVRILNLTPFEPKSQTQTGDEADSNEARERARAETMLARSSPPT
jgi:hypothetical protein